MLKNVKRKDQYLFSALALAAQLQRPTQPPSSRCFASPELTGDILTDPQTRKPFVITSIAVVLDENRRPVGWIYENQRGERLAQALAAMSKRDRDIANFVLRPGDHISGFVRFRTHRNPWADLSIHYCSPHEMSSGKYGSHMR